MGLKVDLSIHDPAEEEHPANRRWSMPPEAPKNTDPLVGCCPRCETTPDRLVHVPGGFSGTFAWDQEDEFMDDLMDMLTSEVFSTDWDQWAFCDDCDTTWQIGHLCSPPDEDDDVAPGDEIEEYEYVAPLYVKPHSAARYFSARGKDDGS